MVDRRRTWAPAAVAIAVAIAAAVTCGLMPAGRAAADGCGGACRSAYNQCRISTKGSPACETQFTSCMQRCRKK